MRLDVTASMCTVEGILVDKQIEKEVEESELLMKEYIDQIIESKLHRISHLDKLGWNIELGGKISCTENSGLSVSLSTLN